MACDLPALPRKSEQNVWIRNNDKRKKEIHFPCTLSLNVCGRHESGRFPWPSSLKNSIPTQDLQQYNDECPTDRHNLPHSLISPISSPLPQPSSLRCRARTKTGDSVCFIHDNEERKNGRGKKEGKKWFWAYVNDVPFVTTFPFNTSSLPPSLVVSEKQPW